MNIVLFTLLVVCFGIMIYQDTKYRHIHVVLPVLVFGVVYYFNNTIIVFGDVLKSSIFLLLNFAVITIYFSIKNSRIINPFKNQIGIGDLVFLIGVTPLFSFRNYVLFFISGMFFALLMYTLFQKRYVLTGIPLAGYLSLYIIVLMVPNMFINTNIFYDFIF